MKRVTSSAQALDCFPLLAECLAALAEPDREEHLTIPIAEARRFSAALGGSRARDEIVLQVLGHLRRDYPAVCPGVQASILRRAAVIAATAVNTGRVG